VKPLWQQILAALLIACLPLQALPESDEEKARRELRQLQGDIKRIEREIASASNRRDTLQKQLRSSEKRLGTLQRDIAANKRDMAARQRELEQLRSERAELEQDRQAQHGRIADEIRNAWQMGRQGQLKVLLNQESPHTVARVMGYYRYFYEARNARLEEYRDTLAALSEVEQRIDDNLQALEQQRGKLEQQQSKLVAAQKSRTEAVAALNASIDSKGASLKTMQRNRKELERLLEAIEEAVVNLEVPQNYQAFNTAKGKMRWPVKGKPSNRFGQARNEGKMRWQGVTIPAGEGAQVQAIHHGRVVYSDWFRGSGLLLIIDHGDGYMSLYAHNQSLLKEVGEWVNTGETVSTVGNSGGLERSALYFEIRHQGKPTDPAKWCRG
jgi:septal ring factor EnvC (AmiA/AmiB activator)